MSTMRCGEASPSMGSISACSTTQSEARWDVKRTEYLECGTRPHEDGGGPEGTPVDSRDEPGGRLDAAAIAAVIDAVILGDA